MSTLRINNIEAQSIPASPTIDEKVKVTNSSGDILVNIDGKTSGITTIGINTTDGNIKFDANSNVLITGILTATTLAGNFTPDSLEIGSNIKLGNAGVITATSFVGSGANLTGLPAGTTINGNTDHYVVTATGTANTLQGESTLLFNNGRLDVTQTTSSSDAKVVIRNSNTPGSGSLRLEFQYGTGNVEGTNRFRFGYVEGYRAGGSNDGGLKFGTKPGNADAPTERLRINPKGQISIRGTTTAFDTTGDLDSLQLYYETDSGQASIGPYSSGGSTHLSFYTNSGGAAATEKLRIRSDGKISAGTSLNASNTYEFSVTGADGTGGFYAHGRNHYLSNRSNAYASLTLKKANADSDGTDYLQLRDSSNGLKLSLSGDGSINGNTVTKLKVTGNEKLRINTNSLWVNSDGMPSSSSGAKLQLGAHTFAGNNFAYATSRLGIQNNGSLTCIANCSTYTDVTYPGYGLIMVQGASTSDYNTFGICPDSPQTGSDLNFHSGYRKSNIHSDANVRQMWINMSGQVYKRDNGANWNQTSDERLKKNIVDNNIGLAEINQLRITSFEYRKADEIDISLFPKADNPLQVIIEGEEGPHTGVIAQEIESVLPECVKTSEKGAKTVQADAVTWALVNAVKELSAKNDALEERIKNLEGS